MAFFDAYSRGTNLQIEAWLLLSWITVGVTVGLTSGAPETKRWRTLITARILLLVGLFLSLYNVVWQASLSILNVSLVDPPVGLYPYPFVIVNWYEWIIVIVIGVIMVVCSLWIEL